MFHRVIRRCFYTLLVILSLFHGFIIISSSATNTGKSNNVYKIEGKIVYPSSSNGLHNTRILVNEGEFVGIPRVDGCFVIDGIPSGSYIVSVSSPRHIFDSVRVDITKNGKIRARKVNLLDPREVIIMKYPLHFETYTVPSYFEKRQVFRLMDFISNPMFLTFIAPIVLFLLVPRLLPQGQEAQDALGQVNGALQPQWNMPDLTDICIRIFGGVARRRRAQ